MSSAADSDSAAAPAAADAEPSAPRAPATAHVLAQAVLDFEEGDAQVRFDEAARRLVLIKHKEFVAMPLAAPAGDARGRSEAQQVIRCENRGKVENVRFSLNHRFVAVQRSDVELELLDLLLGNAFTHLCKGGGSKQRWRILNFQWTGTPVADFLVVTTAGIELYLVLPDKKALKLVKRVEHAVAWCVYSHPTRLVMLATGAHDNIMHGLQVQPQAIVRIPKFEVQLAPPLDASGASAAAELGQQKASRSLLPSQLHVVRLYNAIYCVHVEPERRQLLLYQLFKDFVVRKCAARNSPRNSRRAIRCALLSRPPPPLRSAQVYQENVYGDAPPFVSFKKVLSEMAAAGDAAAGGVQLVSFHSTSKGFFGECGLRGGYFEMVNVDAEVRAQLLKLASISLCSNTVGQLATGLMVRPPAKGEPSHKTYAKERAAILAGLAARAQRIAAALNALPGVTCNAAEGAMYLFPRVRLPKAAVAAAAKQGMAADEYYSIKLLEATGLVVVPGSGFKQVEGTHHFRTTFLPPADMLDEVLPKLATFHTDFIAQHGGAK